MKIIFCLLAALMLAGCAVLKPPDASSDPRHAGPHRFGATSAAIQLVNTGTAPNAGNGDTLYTAFTKENGNWTVFQNMFPSTSGLLRSNGGIPNAFTAATYADILALWTGCASGTPVLTYNGTCSSGGGGGGSGTVTSISVASANGLSGSVTSPTTTPVLSIYPTFTGWAYSNGSAFSAASAGTGISLSGSTVALAAANALTLKGNNTGSSAAPSDVTQAQLSELLELPIVQCIKTMPPQASFSYLQQFAGGSTPAEGVLTNDFPAATATYLDQLCFLKGYHGTGLTLTFSWTACVNDDCTTGTPTGNAVLQASIRRIQSGVTNLTTSYSYGFQSMSATPAASARGIPTTSTISFTDGSQMNGLQDGEFFILRLYRNAGSGSDTMGASFLLLALAGTAT
jgi:hypothetical protein